MENIVSNIEHLLVLLYSGLDASKQSLNKQDFEEANKRLIELQSLRETWSYVWSLLDVSKPVNVQYFGANALYFKLSKHFAEIKSPPSEASNNQIDQLCIHLNQRLDLYMSHKDAWLVTSKLISCAAVLFIQSIGEANLDATTLHWQSNIFQLKCVDLPPEQYFLILVTLMNAIVEEFKNVYTAKARRPLVSESLAKLCPLVTNVIHTVLTTQTHEELIKITTKCYSNWAQKFDSILLDDHHQGIVAAMLNLVSSQSVCQECVQALIDVYTHPFMTNHPKLVMQFVEQITLGLSPLLDQALAESNSDQTLELYKLFIQIGSGHSRLLLDSLDEGTVQRAELILKFLSIILQCSSTKGVFYQDEFVSELSFNFWINFQDDIMGSEDDKLPKYVAIFKDVYLALIQALLIKVQYPPDEIFFEVWDDEEREKFRCYRQDIGDVLMYCYSLLHSSMLQCLVEHFNLSVDQLVRLLNTAGAGHSTEPSPDQINQAARQLEAIFYVFSAISENVDLKKCVFLTHIFSSLPTIQFERINCPWLIESIMNLLSAYSLWLSMNTNYFSFTLSSIATALKSPHSLLVTSATMALKNICQECQLSLRPFASQIVVLCEEGLNSSRLGYREKARLMSTMGLVLSVMPFTEIMAHLERFLVPILAQLESTLNACEESKLSEIGVHVNGVLQMLASLFNTLDVNLKGTDLEDGDELISVDLIKSNQNASEGEQVQPISLVFEKVN